MSDVPALGPINLVEDFDAADDFSKKHTPYIEFCGGEDRTSVCVTVGHVVPHPNQPDHFIGWIELYADGAPIVRVDLTPVATEPKVSIVVDLAPGTVLRAVEHCNLHGLWAMEVTV